MAQTEPTSPEPSMEELIQQEHEDECETTDGCQGGIESDGTCEHGHQTWLSYLGFI